MVATRRSPPGAGTEGDGAPPPVRVKSEPPPGPTKAALSLIRRLEDGPAGQDGAGAVGPASEAAGAPASDPGNNKEGDDDDEETTAVGFGPPPAFPSPAGGALGKRKRAVVMSVSAPAGDDDDEVGTQQARPAKAQAIHRVRLPDGGNDKNGSDSPGRRTYSDAMLLASLSGDHGTPRKDGPDGEAAAEGGGGEDGAREEGASTPGTGGGTDSHAGTPLRSNVNANAAPVPVPKSEGGGGGFPLPKVLPPPRTQGDGNAATTGVRGSPVSPDRDPQQGEPAAVPSAPTGPPYGEFLFLFPPPESLGMRGRAFVPDFLSRGRK